MRHRLFVIVFILLTSVTARAENSLEPVEYPWAVFWYYGRMTENALKNVLRFDYSLAKANLTSFEVSKTLSPENPIRWIFQPIVTNVSFAVNGTYQEDPVGPIGQFNPYLLFRWEHFPWDKYVVTTFAIGEGFSWVSDIPSRESRTPEKAAIARKFYNYLMFEASFARPKQPEWQLVYRLHHRSGVFGLYGPGVNGSTAVGLGVRYQFFPQNKTVH